MKKMTRQPVGPSTLRREVHRGAQASREGPMKSSQHNINNNDNNNNSNNNINTNINSSNIIMNHHHNNSHNNIINNNHDNHDNKHNSELILIKHNGALQAPAEGPASPASGSSPGSSSLRIVVIINYIYIY